MAPPSTKHQTLANSTFLSDQRGIVRFGTVSKSLALPGEVASEKITLENDISLIIKNHSAALDGIVKKRKYDGASGEYLAVKQLKLDQKLPSASTLPVRKTAELKSMAQPVSINNLRETLVPLEAGSFSPSSSSASIFDSDEAQDSSPSSDVSVYFGLVKENEEVQEELSDLHELYNAFLNALSLYYAHNGSRAPVDFNQLKVSIERIWGKRGIEITDIQRVIGVAISEYSPTTEQDGDTIEFPCHEVDTSNTMVPVKLPITEPPRSEPATLNRFPLFLSDYGNGKVCIELVDALLESHLHFYPINITTLIEKFDKAVNRYVINKTPFAKLPLASITPCASLKHISASQKNIRTQIADLKAGAIRAQANNGRNINSKMMPPPKSPLTVMATTSPSDPIDRSNALITRILAKKSLADKKSGPASTKTLVRKAAFQRLDEIVSVLDSLAAVQMRKVRCNTLHKKPGGDQKYSFTMSMLVQSLQMSMRNLISKDEVVTCMSLLAEKSIGKGYVELKAVSAGQKIGGVFGKVVVVKGGVGGLRGKMEYIM